MKYLGVLLDNKLNWKAHVSSLCSKLSRVYGIFYKLRHYIPLNTLRIVYFSLVQSHLQYSLINWGRANNVTLHPLEIMQNKIIRASLFCHKRTLIGNLYVNFHVLKLSDLIKLEYVKFMYRFENNLLPVSFKKYFTNLDCIHAYDTRSKQKSKYFLPRYRTNYGKKSLQYFGIKLWSEFLKKLNVYLTYLLKKYIKTIYLICMNYLMHGCLFIYFSLFSLIFIVYIYLLIFFFLNYNLSVRCRYSFLFVLFHVFLFISCLLTN